LIEETSDKAKREAAASPGHDRDFRQYQCRSRGIERLYGHRGAFDFDGLGLKRRNWLPTPMNDRFQ
jgi:hypothetical protein